MDLHFSIDKKNDLDMTDWFGDILVYGITVVAAEEINCPPSLHCGDVMS